MGSKGRPTLCGCGQSPQNHFVSMRYRNLAPMGQSPLFFVRSHHAATGSGRLPVSPFLRACRTDGGAEASGTARRTSTSIRDGSTVWQPALSRTKASAQMIVAADGMNNSFRLGTRSGAAGKPATPHCYCAMQHEACLKGAFGMDFPGLCACCVTVSVTNRRVAGRWLGVGRLELDLWLRLCKDRMRPVFDSRIDFASCRGAYGRVASAQDWRSWLASFVLRWPLLKLRVVANDSPLA
jgi:hypothetical protein